MQKALNSDLFKAFESGGGKRDRTADLLHAMQALYQLSYTPVCFCHRSGFRSSASYQLDKDLQGLCAFFCFRLPERSIGLGMVGKLSQL